MASKQCSGSQCCHVKLPKLGGDIFTVLVGPEGSEEAIPINAELAKQHSEFFNKELKASSGTLRLPRCSAQHFRTFVAFAYTGQIFTIQNDQKSYHEVQLCADLWILGHSLGSVSFKDAVVDAIYHRRTALNRFPSDLHEILATHLQTQNGVGKLLVDFSILYEKSRVYTQRPLKPECLFFYGEVINALNAVARGVDSTNKVMERLKSGKTCLYHEHDHSAKTCYRYMFPAAPDSPRRPQNSMPDLNTIMTEVRVGSPDVETFAVRRDLAVRYSKFFDKALKPGSDWKEAKENAVDLPDHTPEAFHVFVAFIHSGSIFLDHGLEAKMEPSQDKGPVHDETWHQIAQLWILGEYLESTSFQDAVVDKIVSILQKTGDVPRTMFQEVFKNSVAMSGMRNLLVDVAVYSWFGATLAEQGIEQAYLEFFRDVAVALKERITNPELSAPYYEPQVGCHYHDHGKNEPCYKTMFK